MVIVIRALAAASAATVVSRLIHAVHGAALVRDADAVAGFLHVYGALYGTLFAFLIFVVWGQFNGTEAGVVREARALAELAGHFRRSRTSAGAEVLQTLRSYAGIASSDEWKALARGSPPTVGERAFGELLDAVLRALPALQVHERDAAQKLLERLSLTRAERLAVATARLPPTLWRTLVFATVVLALAVGLLGAESLALSQLLTFSATLVTGLMLGVLADMDNPFDGVYNASKRPFEDLRNV